MTLNVHSAKSPSLLWRVELPEAHDECLSPIFSLDGVDWQFSLKAGDCGEKWTLYLEKQNMPEKVNYLGIIIYIETKKGEFERENLAHLSVKECSTNYVRRYQKMDLENDFKLKGKDLCLLFMFYASPCKATDIIEKAKCVETEERGKQSELSGDMEKLFDTRQHTDVVLKCSDLSFPAHRCILSTRSEVFSAMFRSQMTESTSGQVDIEDLEPTILEPFLRCIYSDNVEALTMDTVMGVYSAAEKYAVHSLKQKCASFMKDNLSEDLVSPVLLLADKFGDSELLEAVLSFVAGKAEFLKTTEWKKFAEQYPLLGVKVYKKFHE